MFSFTDITFKKQIISFQKVFQFIKISCFGWVKNLFLFFQKGSVPAKKAVACMCFPRKLQKSIIFLGKIKKISALEANIGSFQQRSGKYLLFPHQAFVYWAKVCLKTRYTSFLSWSEVRWNVLEKNRWGGFRRI